VNKAIPSSVAIGPWIGLGGGKGTAGKTLEGRLLPVILE